VVPARHGRPPQPRFGTNTAYDAWRGDLVMFGGYLTDYLGDTWEHDGASWREVSTLIGPEPRLSFAMTYEPVRERVVLHGGEASSGALASTWTFSYRRVQPREACSSQLDYDGDGAIGCADDDCWAVCTPLCPTIADPASCPQTPRCGDGMCAPIEDCRSCPVDCAAGGPECLPVCGDFFCDPTESTSCPGDCS
jgi:hypothetical protein